MKEMEWNGTLIPLYSFQTSIFIPQKLGGIKGNEIFFNKIFTKTLKMSLIFFLNIKLSLIPHLYIYIYIYIITKG